METSSIKHLRVFLLLEIAVITYGQNTSYHSSSGLPPNRMALASSHLSTPSNHPAISTVVSNFSNTKISLTEKLMSSTALLLTSSDYQHSSLNDMPMVSDSALLLSGIIQASPVIVTSSIAATSPVNATPSIAAFPVNATPSITATFPVNATPSIAAFPVNATPSITATFPVNATLSIAAIYSVNATPSITATYSVLTTSSSFVTVTSFNTPSSSATAIDQELSTNHISNAYISTTSATGKPYSTILPTTTLVFLSNDISLVSTVENLISTETTVPSIIDTPESILPSANNAFTSSLSRFPTVLNYHSTSSGYILSSIDIHMSISVYSAKDVSIEDTTNSTFLAASRSLVSIVNTVNTPIPSATPNVLSSTEEIQSTGVASPSTIRLSPTNVNANTPVTTLNPFRSVGNNTKMSISNFCITLIINYSVLSIYIVG
ncbi:unnamed protein product [Mytilus coruscus]|uniref:Uncharacterized protein n=1 Tax=Mytilus coruscus TaxID=42192 RepID=A0A6J8AK08_MYTCO|nr:unnamed protein product [Mytilus coruscus]